MRKYAIAAALVTTAISSSAMARDGQWYAGLEGGATIVEDTDLTIYNSSSVTSGATIDNDYGYDFDAIIGYDFGMFRLEAEAAWKEADPETMTGGGFLIPNRTGTTSTLTTAAYDSAGDTNTLSFMINGLLDFGDDDGLQGFVGAGAGIARTNIHNQINSTAGNWVDDSDTGFAWQALAGLRAPISGNWDAGIKYRFFNQSGIDLVSTAGQDIETKVRSHSLMGSLIYNFGAPEVAPPPQVVVPVEPPKPIPVPPPVKPQPCQTGPYIVFFDLDKSDITPQAAAVLDQAVAAYRNCGNARVMLGGYTDRSASVPYNLKLAARRNTSVQNYMQGRGIAAGAFSATAYGEADPRVPTADGVREPQNRRVQITYGPGSGM